MGPVPDLEGIFAEPLEAAREPNVDMAVYGPAEKGLRRCEAQGEVAVTGNLSHLAGELFRMTTGADMTPVPYRGTPAALTALLTGDAHVMFDGLPSAIPHIRDASS